MSTHNQISTSADWRGAKHSSRASRAEPLELPSGATILAARPEPLEWILAGRLPQRLLAAALGEGKSHSRESNPSHPRPVAVVPAKAGTHGASSGGDPEVDSLAVASGNDEAGALMTREEVLELAHFAAQLVRASVVTPAIGDGPDDIRLDDIPVEDRAFIFEWACRAMNGMKTNSAEEGSSSQSGDGRAARPSPDELERFCAQ